MRAARQRRKDALLIRRRIRVLGRTLIGAAAMVVCVQASQTPPPSSTFVTTYCVTCHNDRARTGGLVLENLDPQRPGDATNTWEKAIRKLRAGLMPPPGARRPAPSELDGFTAALEAALDSAAA